MTTRVLGMLLTVLLCLSCADPNPANQRVSPFAEMTSDSANAQQVVADSPVLLPEDHASHPAFSLEWWYFTATLSDISGVPYGLQFTLFRLRQPDAPDSEWSNQQRWLAHLSLHSPDSHFFEEKVARGGVGNAGVIASPFRAFIDHWQWRASEAARPGEMLPGELIASVNDNAKVQLSLSAVGPPVLHGQQGYSVKSSDTRFRSYYYSQPFINVDGTLTLAGQTVAVNGNGWFDHEWTSQLASGEALGWDWLSLTLDDGRKLMAFTMHVEGRPPYTTGTLVSADGTAQTLADEAITLTSAGFEEYQGRKLPVKWNLSVPSAGIDLTLSPFKQGQWNPGIVSYYEGRVEARGSHTATGFLELTGY